MKYKLYFRIAEEHGMTMKFECEKVMSYEEAAASLNKESLAEIIGCAVDDITVITPEQYDEEFGEEEE